MYHTSPKSHLPPSGNSVVSHHPPMAMANGDLLPYKRLSNSGLACRSRFEVTGRTRSITSCSRKKHIIAIHPSRSPRFSRKGTRASKTKVHGCVPHLTSRSLNASSTTPYRLLCNDVQREDAKPSPDLASWLYSNVPLHKIRYGISSTAWDACFVKRGRCM